MLRVVIIFLLVHVSLLSAQGIRLDGDISDWNNAFTLDDAGDNSRLDILSLSISDDSEFIYFKLELDQEILLQSDNNITLNIESSTFEISYNLGEKIGLFQSAVNNEIYHNNLGLVISPTVSSRIFEIRIDKNLRFGSTRIFYSDNIKVSISNPDFNSDKLPNSGTIDYQLTDSQEPNIPSYNLEKVNDTDFRFCSYNVLFDNLFETNTRQEFSAILNTITADVYVFQEIYDFSGQQTQNRLQNVFGALDHAPEWYNSKRGTDNILISRYPIIFERAVAGNGVYVIRIDNVEVLIVNIHLPCCDRDDDRETEIDAILSFIRDAKAGIGNFTLKEGSPIIISGDANFVGNADQIDAFMEGNIFDNGSNGSDFAIDWDSDGLNDLRPFTAETNTMYTWYNPNGLFSRGRLDFAFYSDYSLESLNSFVLDTEVLPPSALTAYNLQPSYSQTCSDHFPIVSDFKINSIVNTEEALSETVTITNPVQGNLSISPKLLESYSINLYNFQGNHITKIDELYTDTSDLTAGLYLLKLISKSNQILTRKIIIL